MPDLEKRKRNTALAAAIGITIINAGILLYFPALIIDAAHDRPRSDLAFWIPFSELSLIFVTETIFLSLRRFIPRRLSRIGRPLPFVAFAVSVLCFALGLLLAIR